MMIVMFIILLLDIAIWAYKRYKKNKAGDSTQIKPEKLTDDEKPVTENPNNQSQPY